MSILSFSIDKYALNALYKFFKLPNLLIDKQIGTAAFTIAGSVIPLKTYIACAIVRGAKTLECKIILSSFSLSLVAYVTIDVP